MATPRWTGGSANVKQVNTLTIAATWGAADTCTLTVDNVDFVVTIGSLVTTAQVATTIQQALSGTTFTDTTASSTIAVADGGAGLIPQFSEFTATVSGSVVTLTGNGSSPAALAGKPFTITVTGDGTAGNGTATMATATTATSQFHANQVDNYSGNAVPANSDTLVFDNNNIDCRYSLSLGVQLAALTKYKSYSGNVGLPEVNADTNSKTYHEYRTPTYLTTNNNSVTCTAALEVGDGPGSGRFKWDYGAGRTDVTIYGQGQPADTGVPCILLKGTHASNTVSNLAGSVGIAFYSGETATIATLVSGPANNASTYCGSGCTLTTVRVSGGSMVTNSAITTATIYAGSWDHYSGTVTTLNLNGGVFRPRGAMTITNCSIYGKIDLSQTAGTVTFTNLVQLYDGGEIYDPNGKAVFSAGYKINFAASTSKSPKVTRPSGDTVTYS